MTTKVAGLVLGVVLVLPLVGLIWTMRSETAQGRNGVFQVSDHSAVDHGKVKELYCLGKDAEQRVRFGIADDCASNVDDDARRDGTGVHVTEVQGRQLVTGYEL